MPAEKRSTPQQQNGVRSWLEKVFCRNISQRTYCRKRYSKMQGKQPTTSEDTERRFLGKSRRLKSSDQSCVRISAPGFGAKLTQSAGTNCALRADWAEFLSQGRFSTKFGVETGKMISATRRNRSYAKRHPERMKRRRFCRTIDSSIASEFYAVPAIDYGRSRSLFWRSRLPTAAFGLYSSDRVWWHLVSAARAGNIFSGVEHHSSLITTQPVRACGKCDRCPQPLEAQHPRSATG